MQRFFGLCIAWAALVLCGCLIWASAHAHMTEEYGDYFKKLTRDDGILCCNDKDCEILADDRWRIAGTEDGAIPHYEVRFGEGENAH